MNIYLYVISIYQSNWLNACSRRYNEQCFCLWIMIHAPYHLVTSKDELITCKSNLPTLCKHTRKLSMANHVSCCFYCWRRRCWCCCCCFECLRWSFSVLLNAFHEYEPKNFYYGDAATSLRANVSLWTFEKLLTYCL